MTFIGNIVHDPPYATWLRNAERQLADAERQPEEAMGIRVSTPTVGLNR